MDVDARLVSRRKFYSILEDQFHGFFLLKIAIRKQIGNQRLRQVRILAIAQSGNAYVAAI